MIQKELLQFIERIYLDTSVKDGVRITRTRKDDLVYNEDYSVSPEQEKPFIKALRELPLRSVVDVKIMEGDSRKVKLIKTIVCPKGNKT